MRALSPAPFENRAFSTPFYEVCASYGSHDLERVVSPIAHNARTFLSSPTRMFTGPRSYRVEGASTFEEHRLASGLVGGPVYWLTGDPLATRQVPVAAPQSR